MAPLDTIWKFPVAIGDSFTLVMPAGSLVLSVGVQEGHPVLWAAVDSQTEKNENHRFFLRGTGHPLGEALLYRFVGTFELQRLVFHLFDGGPEEG